MNIYALISLLASGVCFFLGNFIYYKNPENRLNRLVVILCILVAFLAFTEFGYRQAETMATAEFWLKLSTLWPFVPALLINISLVFTEKTELLKHKITYFIIYAPAFIISAVGMATNLLIINAIPEYWGWTYNIYPYTSFFVLMSIWTIFGAFFAAALLLNYYYNSEGYLERKQAKYIFMGIVTPMIFSLTTDLILPFMSLKVPEFTMTSIACGLIFIAYGIFKYRFPVLTPAMAADKIIDTMSNFLIILNSQKKILLINKSALKLLGYAKEELTYKRSEFIFKTGKQDDELFLDIDENGGVKTFESTLRRKNEVIIPVLMSVSPIKISDNEPHGLMCIGSDLSKEKKIKKALEESEMLYSTLVKTDPDSILTTDLEGNILYASPQTQKLHGFQTSIELIGKSVFQLISPECREKAKGDLEKTLNNGILRNLEYKLLRNDGSQFIGEWNTATVLDIQKKPVAFIATARDITHHKKIKKQMQASILEKEVLLKEIHHRVKNNLQIISSLLNLQSIRIKDDNKAFEVFKESQNRVKTMAMIHEKLYQSGNFAQIDFSEYIHNLISSIFSSYGVNTGDIKLKITGQDVFLDINTAIPCGLIINELVTNTIKHAYSPGNSGELHVSFDKKDDKYVLTVQDNGNGLPDDFDIEKTDTLGLELVKSLVYQLEGKLGVINGDGAIFRISFREQ